ncbi:sensor histidine kinase [Lewinella sp. 4G2]|uniref:sensor histidine kinase n=1 Tax=Lewinella sp. 4G2 TaxID=1803372 RepID=UPI0007B4F2E9|nr:histidine kinase [Lewinella sp. 4G2]OAV43701.1 hypothetical protein A3850_003945 [Lewinella sp. 4G2]
MFRKIPLLQVLLQALAWAAVWFLVFFVLTGAFDNPWRYIKRIWPALVGIFIVVTVNGTILLPKLYFRSRTAYLLVGLVLVIGLSILLHWAYPLLSGFNGRSAGQLRGGGGAAALRYLLPLGLAFFGSALFAVTKVANEQQRRVLEVNGERLATEMKLLKSQINPHFLFNSLNNIYTLTLLQDERGPESLLRLSNMLRYMLYEAEGDTVPLSRELDYLRNYVNLMKLKDSAGLNVRLELDASQPNLPVAPLLFITFVENAFKHGRIEDVAEGYIDIKLNTDAGGKVDFTVTNNLPQQDGPKDDVGGIGLDNLRKRLALLYPDRHTLRVTNDGTTFTAHLQLQTR